jgi:single-strand DNA-binding protein
MSVNKVILVGHVGRDPESRSFQDGTGVTNFSLATSERFKDKASGEYRDAVEWHRVSCFGKLSEIANKYLNKGSQVYVEGKLVTRKWKDTNNVEKSSTEVRADVLQLLGSKEVVVKQPELEISNKASISLGNLEDDVPF